MSGSTSSLLNLLLPLFAGSGTTTKSGSVSTTTSGSTSSADAISNLQNILQQATANGADTTKLNALVTNLFTQAGQNFLPQIGQAASSGLYNSTTLGQVASQAQGQAVNQAASTILNYQTTQNQLADQAANQLAAATKTTTSTTTTPKTTSGTAPIVSPTITLGAAGLLGAKALSDKLGTTAPIMKALGFGPSGGKPDPLTGSDPLTEGGPPDPYSSTAAVTPDAGVTLNPAAGPGGTDIFNPSSIAASDSSFTGSGSFAFPDSTAVVDATGGAALDNGVGAAADILNGSNSPSLWSDVSGVGADAAAGTTQDVVQGAVDSTVNAASDAGSSFLDNIFSLFG